MDALKDAQLSMKDMEVFADWFDEHLKKAERGVQGAPSSEAKADRPPRKVVVGTTILGTYGKSSQFDERLDVLSGLVGEMARQAAEKYPDHGLDLAILPS